MKERVTRVAIDWDGVVVEKKGVMHPKNWAKLGLAPQPGVQEGIILLTGEPDIQIMGIYTARPNWFRGQQTRRQREKFKIPVSDIFHIKGHYAAKVSKVLEDAALNESRLSSELTPPEDLARIVLIDDNQAKILASVEKLKDNPRYTRMLNKLTIVTFAPNSENVKEGILYEGLSLQLISLQSWDKEDVKKMLAEVRTQATNEVSR